MKKIKYPYKFKKKNSIFIIIIMIIISIILLFKIINKKVNPIFMQVAESETKKFATLVVNDAINKNVNKELSDQLFTMTKDSNDNITSLEFNTVVVNKTLTIITNNVLLNLKAIEDGNIESLRLSDELVDTYNRKNLEKGIIYRIPTGVIFNNSLLNNIGPKIPVKLNFIGEIESDISTKTTNYGINNALIEVYVTIKVEIEVILPLTSKKTSINNKVPIIIKSVQGNVPQFYSGTNNPSISIPID